MAKRRAVTRRPLKESPESIRARMARTRRRLGEKLKMLKDRVHGQLLYPFIDKEPTMPHNKRQSTRSPAKSAALTTMKTRPMAKNSRRAKSGAPRTKSEVVTTVKRVLREVATGAAVGAAVGAVKGAAEAVIIHEEESRRRKGR